MQYRAYGHVIAGPARLWGLPRSSDAPVDIAIELTADPAPAVPWPAAPTPDVDPWLQVVPTAQGCLLRFADVVTCLVALDGRTIRVYHDGLLTDTIEHLLVDQVLPLVIAHRGNLVLHGAGLSVGGRGVGLVGPSGAGKSTLAGSLMSRGAAVFADDALVCVVPSGLTDLARVFPAYPVLRLWPDVMPAIAPDDVRPLAAYTTKRRVAVSAGITAADDPVVLDRVYVVDPDPASVPAITPVTKRDAMVALLTHSYVLDPSDGDSVRRQFDAVAALVDRLTVRRLRYPRDLARLPEVGAALDDDLRMR